MFTVNSHNCTNINVLEGKKKKKKRLAPLPGTPLGRNSNNDGSPRGKRINYPGKWPCLTDKAETGSEVRLVLRTRKYERKNMQAQAFSAPVAK